MNRAVQSPKLKRFLGTVAAGAALVGLLDGCTTTRTIETPRRLSATEPTYTTATLTASPAKDAPADAGIGLIHEHLSDSFAEDYDFETRAGSEGLEIYRGTPERGGGAFRMVGLRGKILEASITVPVDAAGKVNGKDLQRLERFVDSLSPEWRASQVWVQRAVGGATSMPGTPATQEVAGVEYVLLAPRMLNLLTLTARPRTVE